MNGSLAPRYMGQYAGRPPTRLQALRLAAGLTCEQLSRALGYRARVHIVSDVELGRRSMPGRVREAWAAALGVSVEALEGG